MPPLLLALALAAPGAPAQPTFAATGAGGDSHTGSLRAISFKLGARIDTPGGEAAVKNLVGLRQIGTARPALPTGPQLITGAGDRIPGRARGGDAKVIQFRPAGSADDWSVALDAAAAVWLVAPPADTPADPARYAWLAGTPPRDVLLYRNGDAVRGTLGGFINGGVKFTPDGGQARDVELADLAAIGFNPRFVRARKPKGPYARLTLSDGTRLDATELAAEPNAVVGKALCGPAFQVPLAKLVALDVFQGPATYLSDLKPKKAEVAGFLGEGWPWAADRTVRGRPLRLVTADGVGTFDKGLGTHPKTVLSYDLAGKYSRFESLVGLDAATGKRGRAGVRIKLDGKEVDLPALKALAAGPAVAVSVDLRGAKELTLVVDFGPTGDVQSDVDWAGARLVE
jgi:hypothetical protein